MLKLDLNENTEGLLGYARQEDYERAKKNASKYFGVSPKNLVITNGSFHALQLISTFFLNEKDELLLSTPNFVFYTPFEQYKKFKVKKVPFNKNFSVESLIKNIGKNTKVIYIANPNNPIGSSHSKQELEKVIKAANLKNVKVVIDEAYFEFNGITVKDLVEKFPNLYVLRSFSKAFGLAGLRMGAVITNSKNADEIEKIKGPSYIISRLGLERLESMNSKDFSKVKKQSEDIKKSREIFEKFLKEKEIEYFPSSGNFVTFKVSDSLKFTEAMEKKEILVSDISKYPDGEKLLKNHIRFTLPPSKEIKKVISVVEKLI